MAYRKHLLPIVLLMFFMFFTHKGAEKFYWYNSVSYFDMIMHFLGGLWLGLFFTYVYSINKINLGQITIILSSVLLIGLSWEVFEFIVNNVIAKTPFDLLDTISDIFWDLMGGFISILYFLKKVMPVSKNNM